MNTDRFFGGPTALTSASPLVTTHSHQPAAFKAVKLYKIGVKLRRMISDAAFRPPESVPTRPFDSLPPKDQGLFMFVLLSANSRLLDSLRDSNPDVAQLVVDFQELVPLTSPRTIPLLTSSPDTQTAALEKAVERFEGGSLSAELLAQAAKSITGLSLSTPADIKAHILAQPTSSPTAPRWVFYGAGSESKAYQDGSGLVYKVAPVNEAMLDIPPILNDGPLYPRIGAHLFSNALMQIPILERGLATATFPGLAPTEIVALTPSGDVVFKQVDFGNDEPTADELHAWASQYGHVPLPSQGEDPEKVFDNDTSVIPVVVHDGTRFHLILDLNPRNCRVVHVGEKRIIVPFDVISRPLLAQEIKAHPQIKAAVAELRRRPTIE
jgi:hypothetical protein